MRTALLLARIAYVLLGVITTVQATNAQQKPKPQQIKIAYSPYIKGFAPSMKTLAQQTSGWIDIRSHTSIPGGSDKTIQANLKRNYINLTILVKDSEYWIYLNQDYRLGMKKAVVIISDSRKEELPILVALLAIENYITKHPADSRQKEAGCIARQILMTENSGKFRPIKGLPRSECLGTNWANIRKNLEAGWKRQ